jgi:hypothetical protein
MNAVEIEEAISALAEQPFDAEEFPFAFLLAVNEHAKLTRFQHLKLTHPLWCKALRRAALI